MTELSSTSSLSLFIFFISAFLLWSFCFLLDWFLLYHYRITHPIICSCLLVARGCRWANLRPCLVVVVVLLQQLLQLLRRHRGTSIAQLGLSSAQLSSAQPSLTMPGKSTVLCSKVLCGKPPATSAFPSPPFYHPLYCVRVVRAAHVKKRALSNRNRFQPWGECATVCVRVCVL